MKKTLQDQYLLIKEGKGHKDIFIKEAKRQFPGLIRNAATYTEVANVLKTKNLINENVIGLEPINQLEPSKKESYEVAFENFLAEAKKKKEEDEKAELKKPSKQVEEDAEKNFDYGDKKNPDNLIFDQIMKGYYAEMKDPKNESKTMEQLKAIVIKNLEKNPTYYTEKGQFGVKDLGYTSDVPGLGEPKEPKGKFKSSGYGDLKESKEPINEEDQIRKVVRSIINEELEEMVDSEENERYFIKDKKRRTTSQLPGFHKPALGEEELEEGYDDREMGTYQSMDTRHYKNPQDMETYLNAIKGMDKVKAIEYLGGEGLSSSMVMRVVNKADKMGMYDVQDMFDVNPRIRGDVFEFKKDDTVMYMGEKHKVVFSDGSIVRLERNNGDVVTLNQPQADEKVRYQKDFTESVNESKIKKVIRESIEKELAQINKEAEFEILDSKLEKITDLIDKRKTRLAKLDEDEDIKALTDKKKVKQFEKEIKTLEKAKAKIEKALAKKDKATPKKKEVIDEDEELGEAIDPKKLEDTDKALDDITKKVDDIGKSTEDMFEEEMADDAPADYSTAKEDAEGRYEAGEELDSILSDYPKFRETLERDILGKFDGMDY